MIFLLLVGANQPCQATGHAVVFMYHRFGASETPSTNVTAAQFEAHLNHLKQQNYHVWPLQRIVDHLRDSKPLPDKTVAITMDDAYASIYTVAFPLLRRFGWPFAVFVATDPVDNRLPGYLSWAQMREMKKYGASFANHSSSHDHLIRLKPGENQRTWSDRARKDIAQAQQRLRAELGHALRLFAYPYGEYNLALADIVSELGFVGFGQHSGAIGSLSDRRALPRYPMAEAYASDAEFRLKAMSLALPVKTVKPWNPVLGTENPPRMVVTLGTSDALLDRLNCFVSGQGALPVRWLRTSRQFEVKAREPLPQGRSRYNCTAPSKSDPRRYYWYSHLWIR